MADFQFRLKNVETLRLRNRDMAAESLRQAHEAKKILLDQKSDLEAEVVDQSTLQSQSATGVLQTQRVLESQRYQLHLLSQIKQLQEKIDLVEQECQRRQKALIERETEVKALEKLRETQQAQWQHLQFVRAQNRLDEWASYRHWSTTEKSPDKVGDR